jgi:hypothetical protein
MGVEASLVVELDDGRRIVYRLDPRSLDIEGRWNAFGMEGRLVVRGGRASVSVEHGAGGYLLGRLRGRGPSMEQLKVLAELFSCLLGLPVDVKMGRVKMMGVHCPEKEGGG